MAKQFVGTATSYTAAGADARFIDNDEQTQALITAPVDGCYMTGVGDLTGNTAKIDYAAIVTPLSNTMKNATVANVVFVIEWDTVA